MRTVPFAPGFHLSTAPLVALNAATFWRLTSPDPGADPGGRTIVNWPPTYITLPENVMTRTVPFVCHEELGGNGFAASACPGPPPTSTPATATARNSPRRMRPL